MEARELTDNRRILAQLEQERNLLSAGYGVSGSVMLGGVVSSNPLVAAGGIGASTLLLRRIEKLSRIVRVMSAILDAFESQGVEIFPRVEVPGHNPIDLYVRFKGLAHLIISIRSMGQSEIVYKEATETLLVKRKGKGMKKWHPDPLVELSEYQAWLIKNRQQFGISSKEVRKPLAKVLVISGETRIDEHREHLYTTVSGETFLALSRKGTAMVILEEQVINFMKAYLANYKAQEA